MTTRVKQIAPMEIGGRSSNITYYRERGGLVWVAVLCSNIARRRDGQPGYTRKAVADYHATIYRDGDGEIGEFTYTPSRGRGELAARTVTRLVREALA